MKKKAPNNQFPPTHFIELYDHIEEGRRETGIIPIAWVSVMLKNTKEFGHNTIALFKIRENIVPTLHKFNQ